MMPSWLGVTDSQVEDLFNDNESPQTALQDIKQDQQPPTPFSSSSTSSPFSTIPSSSSAAGGGAAGNANGASASVSTPSASASPGTHKIHSSTSTLPIQSGLPAPLISARVSTALPPATQRRLEAFIISTQLGAHRSGVASDWEQMEQFNSKHLIHYYDGFCIDHRGAELSSTNIYSARECTTFDVPRYRQPVNNKPLSAVVPLNARIMKCFNCGATGHGLRDCPLPKSQTVIHANRRRLGGDFNWAEVCPPARLPPFRINHQHQQQQQQQHQQQQYHQQQQQYSNSNKRKARPAVNQNIQQQYHQYQQHKRHASQ
jgi:hypothetical protein